MSRIRSIKPEFPQSETIGRLSRDARLLFVQLWTVSDDEGRTRAASRMLASLLYPYDDDAPALMDGWLEELEAAGCIRRYASDGSSYLEICNWLKHQKIDRPSKSKIPAFDESSSNPREPSSTDLGSRIIGSRIKDTSSLRSDEAAAPPKKSPKAEKPSPRQILETVLTAEMAEAVIDHRRRKRADLGAVAAEGLAKAFDATGDPNAAARTMIERGWQGFKPEWFHKDRKDDIPKATVIDAADALVEWTRQSAGTGGEARPPHVRLLSSG